MSSFAPVLARVRARVAHAKRARFVAVSIDIEDVEALLACVVEKIKDLREAETYIAQLRVPLLTEFGTNDPDLLIELFSDRHSTERTNA